MSSRVVILGNRRAVSLGAYVRAWRAVAALPAEQEVKHGLTGWWSDTAGSVLRQFRDGLHDRINRHVPGFGRGRKWDPDWQREVGHAARRLNTPRLIVRPAEVPLWLRARMAHRLHTNTED